MTFPRKTENQRTLNKKYPEIFINLSNTTNHTWAYPGEGCIGCVPPPEVSFLFPPKILSVFHVFMLVHPPLQMVNPLLKIILDSPLPYFRIGDFGKGEGERGKLTST